MSVSILALHASVASESPSAGGVHAETASCRRPSRRSLRRWWCRTRPLPRSPRLPRRGKPPSTPGGVHSPARCADGDDVRGPLRTASVSSASQASRTARSAPGRIGSMSRPGVPASSARELTSPGRATLSTPPATSAMLRAMRSPGRAAVPRGDGCIPRDRLPAFRCRRTVGIAVDARRAAVDACAAEVDACDEAEFRPQPGHSICKAPLVGSVSGGGKSCDGHREAAAPTWKTGEELGAEAPRSWESEAS
jgi:hypothetical protein